MPTLRTTHLTIGILGLIAFALTGQYMHWVHAGLQGMPDGPRMFLRSAHIYLLWSSMLNFLLGCYLTRVAAGVGRQVQWVASLLILAGPFMLLYAFFFEPYTPELLRPVGSWAIFLTTLGVAGQAVALMVARWFGRGSRASAQ